MSDEKKPFGITVVITAFNRDRYIPEAIDSVKRSIEVNGSQIDCQIIVVKDVISADLELILKNKNVQYYSVPGENNGPRVFKGIKESSFDIITFLEDDDLFYPDKIGYLRNFFTSNREVAYFENGMTLIDSDSNPINGREWIIEKRKVLSHGRDYIIKKDHGNGPLLQDLIDAWIGRNLSCITIRKSLYGNNLDCLQNIALSVDMMLFWLSQKLNLPVALGALPLTKYRLHSNQASTVSADKGSFKLFKKQLLPVQTKFLLDRYEISKILQEDLQKAKFILLIAKLKNKNLALQGRRPLFSNFVTVVGLLPKYDKHRLLSLLWQTLTFAVPQLSLFIEFLVTMRHINLEV